ncbi:MAG: nucleotidyltransferase domain-containing protein [Patescibacteria group bacterium]|nr:nucleotidyltransferase domain-containing protein [Patescibacteria group bacterium]
MLKNFYKNPIEIIKKDVQEWVESVFFVKFPKWKHRVAIIVMGSVPSGAYDKYSDLDLQVIASEKELKKYSLNQIKEFKKLIIKSGLPIQLHKPVAFSQVKKLGLEWSNDGEIREYSRALIISDPSGEFERLKKNLKKYPRNVLKEKLDWLIAESNFNIADRLKIAVERKNEFYIEALKIETIRYLMNAYIMGNGACPVYDKHLFSEIEKIGHSDKYLISANKLMRTRDGKEVLEKIKVLRDIVMTDLIHKRLIPKRTEKEWCALRPKRKVVF